MEATLFWIELFTAFILYQVIQAVFINGIKLAASGSTEILPDGTHKDSEMILYPMAKFLLQKKTCKIFYKGEQLAIIFMEIKQHLNTLKGLQISGNNLQLPFDLSPVDFLKVTPYLNKALGIDFILLDNGISVYKEFPKYRFSKWLRKPIIECVVCMGSFWGIITFLIPVLFITHSFMAFPAYVVNALCLACTNKYIYNLSK